jgi:hypothetical protein
VEESRARHGPRALSSPEWEAREVATPRRRSPKAGLGCWRWRWWGGVAADAPPRLQLHPEAIPVAELALLDMVVS